MTNPSGMVAIVSTSHIFGVNRARQGGIGGAMNEGSAVREDGQRQVAIVQGAADEVVGGLHDADAGQTLGEGRDIERLTSGCADLHGVPAAEGCCGGLVAAGEEF